MIALRPHGWPVILSINGNKVDFTDLYVHDLRLDKTTRLDITIGDAQMHAMLAPYRTECAVHDLNDAMRAWAKS